MTRRKHAALVMLGLVALALAGCRVPPSALDLDRLEPINAASIAVETIFSFTTGGAGLQAIATDERTGYLQVVMPTGVVWLTPAGNEQRRIAFDAAPRGGLAPVVRLRDARSDYYAGFELGVRAGALAFFDADGREIVRHPCQACFVLTPARVDAEDADSLLVRAMDGSLVTVYGGRGSTVRTVKVPGYLTDLAALRLPGERLDAMLFYVSPDPDLRAGVRVVDAPGHERAKWPVTTRGAIATSTSSTGVPSVIALDGQDVVEHEATTGAVMWRMRIEGAGGFRRILASWWRDGWRILVLSGPSTLDRHLVAVVDPAGTLVYRAVGPGRAFALHAPPKASEFYVAVGHDLRRFSIG